MRPPRPPRPESHGDELRRLGGHRAAALTLVLLLSPACATKSAATSDGASRPDTGTPAPTPTCDSGSGYAGPPTMTSFSHLSATVVDLDGNPVPHVKAQACGVDICVNGTTDAQGSVVIDQSTEEIRPAFKYGGGELYAKFALPLRAAGVVSVDLGDERTVAFDAPSLGATLVPGAAATSRGITLTLASGGAVTIDPFDYDTPDLKKFRAAEIPIARAPAAVDPALGLGLLVALTPAGAVLCPRAKLGAPNTPGWPAGSHVEFFVHGAEVSEQFAPYGGWAKVSDGAVTADGASVETDDAGGLPILSVVGVRLAR